MVNILLAGGVSMVVALLGTPLFARYLVRRRYGQFIHDDLTHHHYKRGKPTMGGVVILGATVAGYLVSHGLLLLADVSGLRPGLHDPLSPSAGLVLFLMLGLGLVGFLDDYTKVSRERSLGLTSRQKLAGQAVVTLMFALGALFVTDDAGRAPASTAISFIRDTGLDLAFAGPVLGVVLFVLWANLLITGASNGVNISDGLDGLAAGASVMVFGAYTLIALWQNNQSCAAVPGAACYEVPDALDLAVVACSVAGACFGFLWWNASPAQIIMGDTGSLSLGAGLAGMAILTRTELLLVVLGGLFVIITLSVIIQVASFRLRGKRVFRMAPLHHHFELLGWAEITIVIRFWIIAGICVAAGLGLFYAGWVVAL
ncbi:phospho-N-acetylmuramoyl-pentapeptide-transferase [Nostocoides sp. Soil756]|jgi:phospho-N-acetylmuramoyl-pentapeptide-transferase|uniref:phospho-N-acetylmuramoyl-pentapeptide- transferase n=1 Tax=Nostocoides sp. Soil756 TaxID=1736399 RepID=UPI0006F73DFB|nr:phospho-N-acetylmuramoyl-pentapeptide-transferase [Tetrasphaera sp. Soil756]KRE62475.1 phospho-N-acetylmuramoyl-pentapeptide-transferase [Tetrasphaera sp. Soil756]